MRVQPLTANIVHDLGAGAYRWADVILGGLDNREARVAINRAAARAGKIWIDGAIERLQGVARVFDPACGPCYECTMNEIDWKMLQARRSCALLTRDDMEEGKVPTVSTTASVIAGIQCQEAVKLIHGLEVLAGRGFVFEGMTHSSYVVAYTRKDDCPAHEPDEPVQVLPLSIAQTRAGDFLERVRSDLGAEAVIETEQRPAFLALLPPLSMRTSPTWVRWERSMSGRGDAPSARSTARPTFTTRSMAARPSWTGPWANLASPCGTFWPVAADSSRRSTNSPATARRSWEPIEARCNPEPAATVASTSRRRDPLRNGCPVRVNRPGRLGYPRWSDALMAEKSDPLDVAQLAQRDLSKTAFPGGKQDFRVFFDPQIHQRIAAHAAERLSLEICGVLVGHWHRDADGPFVLVNESIRCDKALSNAGDVTFTHEAWNEVHQQMDSKFTDRDIVGWYHSHPNFGIFLSDRDLFIQEHFFNGPGQIAYVVDPVNGVEGVFAWRNGKAKLYPHFWVGDEIHLSSQGAARKPSSAAAAGQPPPSAPKPDALPPISSSIAWLLVAVCFLLLGYFLGDLLTRADRAITTRDAVTHYGVFKGLKLGMREDMNKVGNIMQNTAQRVVDLANEHISSLAGDAQEEKRKQWNEVVQNLKVTLIALEEIKKVYSLTPDEAAEVERLIIAGKGAESENDHNPTAKDSAARDSGQKINDAKPSEKPAAEPAKSGTAPPPAKAPDVKPLESKPADTAKPAATNQKPQVSK